MREHRSQRLLSLPCLGLVFLDQDAAMEQLLLLKSAFSCPPSRTRLGSKRSQAPVNHELDHTLAERGREHVPARQRARRIRRRQLPAELAPDFFRRRRRAFRLAARNHVGADLFFRGLGDAAVHSELYHKSAFRLRRRSQYGGQAHAV